MQCKIDREIIDWDDDNSNEVALFGCKSNKNELQKSIEKDKSARKIWYETHF